MKLPVLSLTFALAALLLGAASHLQAAPKKPPQAAAPTAQVDGIVSAAVDALWAQDDRYWHGGDYPRIVALDRIITQADPHFLECYETGGWLMESQGQTADAESFYQQNVANNGDASEAYYHLGMFYFNTLHNYPAALATFQKGTVQDDADINDWKMLAHSYERVRDWNGAVAAWRTIKSRWPNGVAVDINLNHALASQRAARS